MPKDELLSHFYETPSVWGEHQNTPCSSFVKGSRFLNMAMTFVLTPLSYYNFIIEPRAWFLLSLLEDRFIDFPTHFITSFIDVYQDTTTCNKLIFSFGYHANSLSFFYPYSWFSLLHCYRCHQRSFCSTEWGPASTEVTTDKTTDPAALAVPSTSAPSSSSGVMTLEAIMV